MNIQDIKELMSEVKRLDLAGFEYKNNGIEIKIDNSSRTAVAVEELNYVPSEVYTVPSVVSAQNVTEAPKSEISGEEVKSPIVGVFYAAPSPDHEPFVTAGATVKKGAVICIVEAMKVMNEIVAEYDMKILKVNPNDGDMVEFSEALFVVERI